MYARCFMCRKPSEYTCSRGAMLEFCRACYIKHLDSCHGIDEDEAKAEIETTDRKREEYRKS